VHIVPTKLKLDAEQQRLLGLFSQLAIEDRATLIAFAEFLAERLQSKGSHAAQAPLEPKPIERPAEESVVKAIKRLSATYYMIERDQLFDETSSLMMSHIMQGRETKDVIDDLEALFNKHYQDYLDSC
jgi:hypothetical protein